MKKYLTVAIIVSVFFGLSAHAAEDPWAKLRKQVKKNTGPVAALKIETHDPWKRLRSVYLPFSIHEEQQATADPGAAKSFVNQFNTRLLPYDIWIQTASKRFDIPVEVLKALIMAESGGDPYARAKTTSAKGLMQTIDSTFSLARNGLEKKGITIADDPFDPQAAIMAGAFYLDQMFEQCIKDGRMVSTNRTEISSWRYPLEYYYAGPLHGVKEKNKIYVFSNGKKRMIDKRAYSGKVLKWAGILAG